MTDGVYIGEGYRLATTQNNDPAPEAPERPKIRSSEKDDREVAIDFFDVVLA